MSGSNPSFVAGGDINPSRFVTYAATGVSNQVIQAATDTLPIVGVSQEYTRLAPTPSASTLAAVSGDSLKVYGLGDVCEITVGGSALDAGDLLMTDSDGKAIVATAGKQYGARALVDAAANGRVKAQIMFGQVDSDT